MKKIIFAAVIALLAIVPVAAQDFVFRDPLINNQFTQNAFDSAQAFTVSAWVKPRRLHNEDYRNPVISQHGEASGWEIRLAPRKVVFMFTVNGKHRYLEVKAPVRLNEWMHVKAGYDDGQMTLYVNNELLGSKQVRHNPTPWNGSIYIARNGYWKDRQFKGQVRDLEIIGTIKKAAELSSNPIKGTDTTYGSSSLEADFSKPKISGDFSITTRGTDANPYYKGSHRLLRPNRSYVEAKVDLSRPGKYSTLRLSHLTSMSGGRNGYSPITINVNGVDVVKDHNPNNGNYISEDFNVRNYLRRGENTIRISLGSARTHYWIKKMELL